jgi:hypothetical protein
METTRAHLYHIQLGFGVMWKCKDRTYCDRRVQKLVAAKKKK